jgi:hypothetical protein
MKHLVLLLFVSVSLPPLSAQTTDSLDAKIVRLLELSGAEAQFLSAVDGMLNVQRQNLPEGAVDDEFWDEFSKEIRETGYADLRPLMVEIYRINMTEEEIDHQIAYYGHPLTQEIVKKQPVIVQQSMAVGAEWGRQLSQKIITRLQEYRKG